MNDQSTIGTSQTTGIDDGRMEYWGINFGVGAESLDLCRYDGRWWEILFGLLLAAASELVVGVWC